MNEKVRSPNAAMKRNYLVLERSGPCPMSRIILTLAGPSQL